SINLLNLLVVPAVAASPAAVTLAPGSPAPLLPDVKLTDFSLTGLAVEIEDRTTPVPARNGLRRLDVNVQNISLAQASAPVLLKLALEGAKGGTVSVEGSAVREPLAADLVVRVDAFPLAGATPYVVPMLNIKIADGSVSVDGKARLAGMVA